MLDVHKVHRQATARDGVARLFELVSHPQFHVIGFDAIFIRHAAQDFAARWIRQLRDAFRSARTKNLTDLDTALAAYDYVVAAIEDRTSRRREHANRPHRSVPHNVTGTRA